MHPDLLDILSRSPDLDPQKLLDYLEGRLPEEERHAVEKLLADSAFDNDAVEGLQEVKDKEAIPLVVHELNRQLIEKLKARRKKGRRPPPNIILPVAVTAILLLIVVLVYFFIRALMRE